MNPSIAAPIFFKCYDELVKFTLGQTKDQNDKNAHLTFLTDPPITEVLNTELNAYGLPNATCFILVKRRNMFDISEASTHVDSFTQDPDLIHQVSIVIPVENCDKAPMIWYDGDYVVELSRTKEGYTYPLIKWNSKPSACYKEFITTPMVCNISMPHSALSPEDGSYRTVLTFRLEGNPSFEEVCQKILTAQNS